MESISGNLFNGEKPPVFLLTPRPAQTGDLYFFLFGSSSLQLSMKNLVEYGSILFFECIESRKRHHLRGFVSKACIRPCRTPYSPLFVMFILCKGFLFNVSLSFIFCFHFLLPGNMSIVIVRIGLKFIKIVYLTNNKYKRQLIKC
uniref:Uncharacterized protein n=1 Tax=Cacopsylla melanoneura TaxID=428564 RepID=A0A8D8VA60_9HEMI